MTTVTITVLRHHHRRPRYHYHQKIFPFLFVFSKKTNPHRDKSNKDKITFKAIEKHRYGLRKTVSKHLKAAL